MVSRLFGKTPLRLLGALLLLAALAVAGMQIHDAVAPTLPRPAQSILAQKGGLDQAAYSIGGETQSTGHEQVREDSHELLDLQQDWLHMLTYPTGQLLGGWLQKAAAQDRLIPSGVPAGRVTYDRSKNRSPLVLDPTSWTSLGPQPEQTDGCYNCYNYGPVSGRATDVIVDPVTPNVAYVAAAGGSVWKTTTCCSATTTWRLIPTDPAIAGSGVNSIAIDPNDHNTIYIGTGEANFAIDNLGAYGLLKSTDAGDSWTVQGLSAFGQTTPWFPTTPPTYRYQALSHVLVDPANSDNLVVNTMNGVYFSYDAGTNWSGPCYTNPYGSTNSEVMQGLVLSSDGTTTTIYSAVGWYSGTYNGANGVYSTTIPTSGGCPASWNLLNNGWPAGTGNGTPDPAKPGRIDLAIAPSNPNVIYAEASDPTTSGLMGVWRTTDAGATWTLQSDASALGGCGFDYGQNWYDQGLKVDPNNPDVLFMDTFDIWKSIDGGVTWQDVTCGYGGGTTVHVDQHGLAYAPGSSSTLMAVSDGGVYVTHNADVAPPALPDWQQLNESLNTIQFYSGDTTGNFATSANPGASGGTQDNGSSVAFFGTNPSPEQWQMRIGGDGFYSRIEPVNAQHWYQGNNSGHIWVSSAGPYGPWTDATGGWTADTRGFIMPFEIYKGTCPPAGCQHLIVGSYRIWETINGGLTAADWYTDSERLTRTTGSAGYIRELQFAPSDDSVAAVGTNDGYVQYGYGLGTGTSSATWVNISDGNTVLPNRTIMDVDFDPSNALVGYAAVGSYDENTPTTPGHLFQFTCTANCASVTWLDKTGNLPDVPAYSVKANPHYPQQVFVGSEWGLYFTNDITANPPTWTRFDAGLPRATAWDITVDYGETVLVLWTHGHGAYVWPLPSGPFVQPTATPTVTGTPPTATPQPSATATGTPGSCYTYSYATATTTLIPATNDTGNHCDDCSSTVPLPFPVTLYDQTFTQGYADSNGSFQLGLANASLYNGCLPDRNESYSILLYQNDLCTTGCGSATCATCGVYTETLGTAPNREFVVEWHAIHYGVTEPPNDFEVIFHESGQPSISVVYGATSDQGANETTGIQQTANTTWTQFTCNTPDLTDGLQVDYTLNVCATATPGVTQTPTQAPTSTATPPGPTGTPSVTETPCPLPFTDVHPADYFYVPVQYLYCHGVISGYADHTFRPYSFTTRSQMVKIVVLGFGIPIVTPPAGGYTFADVKPGFPFFDVIETAAHDNIVSGYDCGGPGEPCDSQNRPYFRPYNNVTRGQLSKIDVVAAGWDLLNPPDPSFTDVLPNTAFYTFVETAYCHGIISGYDCGGPGEPCDPQNRPYFRQYNDATRGQISKIVYLSIMSPPGTCPGPGPTNTPTP